MHIFHRMKKGGSKKGLYYILRATLRYADGELWTLEFTIEVMMKNSTQSCVLHLIEWLTILWRYEALDLGLPLVLDLPRNNSSTRIREGTYFLSQLFHFFTFTNYLFKTSFRHWSLQLIKQSSFLLPGPFSLS